MQGNVVHLRRLLAILPLMCQRSAPSLRCCTSNASLQLMWEISSQLPTARGWFAFWKHRRQWRWWGVIEPDTSPMTNKRMSWVRCTYDDGNANHSSEVALCPLLPWYCAKLSWNIWFRDYQYVFYLEKIIFHLGKVYFNLLLLSI